MSYSLFNVLQLVYQAWIYLKAARPVLKRFCLVCSTSLSGKFYYFFISVISVFFIFHNASKQKRFLHVHKKPAIFHLNDWLQTHYYFLFQKRKITSCCLQYCQKVLLLAAVFSLKNFVILVFTIHFLPKQKKIRTGFQYLCNLHQFFHCTGSFPGFYTL